MLACRLLSLSKAVVHSSSIYASQRQKQQVSHLWHIFNRPGSTSKRFFSKSRSIKPRKCDRAREWVRAAPRKRTGVSSEFIRGATFSTVWQLGDLAVDPLLFLEQCLFFVSVNVVNSHTSNWLNRWRCAFCVLTVALFDVFVLCVCVPVWARL